MQAADSPVSRAKRPPPHPARRAAAAAGLLALLSSCGPPPDPFPPAYPHAGTLADIADLTRYRPGATGHDLRDVVIDGHIIGVSGTCTRIDRHHLDVSVTTSLRLVRGPAAHGNPGAVPVFLAVSRGGRMLDKQIYQIAPNFPSNADTLLLTSDPVNLILPIGPDTTGAAYDVVVGFQLTADEVSFNRARGPR